MSYNALKRPIFVLMQNFEIAIKSPLTHVCTIEIVISFFSALFVQSLVRELINMICHLILEETVVSFARNEFLVNDLESIRHGVILSF